MAGESVELLDEVSEDNKGQAAALLDGYCTAVVRTEVELGKDYGRDAAEEDKVEGCGGGAARFDIPYSSMQTHPRQNI
jgi:hypothetical protein